LKGAGRNSIEGEGAIFIGVHAFGTYLLIAQKADVGAHHHISVPVDNFATDGAQGRWLVGLVIRGLLSAGRR
jgi:hypothetical protein